jgi:hypothetical protein
VGKTALLDYLAGQASGCQVVRSAGVQSEMELAFAGLHQLCLPLLEYAGRLPQPQRGALRVAFGLSAGPAPDRFVVGLAVLGLLSEAAGERPLVCEVDDLQWLDRASAQALGFAARRPVQSGDRHPDVPQPANGRVAPAQGIHEARHHLPAPAPRHPAP